MFDCFDRAIHRMYLSIKFSSSFLERDLWCILLRNFTYNHLIIFNIEGLIVASSHWHGFNIIVLQQAQRNICTWICYRHLYTWILTTKKCILYNKYTKITLMVLVLLPSDVCRGIKLTQLCESIVMPSDYVYDLCALSHAIGYDGSEFWLFPLLHQPKYTYTSHRTTPHTWPQKTRKKIVTDKYEHTNECCEWCADDWVLSPGYMAAQLLCTQSTTSLHNPHHSQCISRSLSMIRRGSFVRILICNMHVWLAMASVQAKSPENILLATYHISIHTHRNHHHWLCVCFIHVKFSVTNGNNNSTLLRPVMIYVTLTFGWLMINLIIARLIELWITTIIVVRRRRRRSCLWF